MTSIASTVFQWEAEPNNTEHWRPIPTIARRIAYVLQEPLIDREGATVAYDRGAAVVSGTVAHVGVPIRNQVNKARVEWGDHPFVVTLRETDSFGEVLIVLDPAVGSAEAYSITIDRTMKGGVSAPSPRPEEQMIHRIGRFRFDSVSNGIHELCVEAVEEKVKLSIDWREVLAFDGPDVTAGCFGIGAAEQVRVYSFEQVELISREEAEHRDEFVRKMNEFCHELDLERDADIASSNELTVEPDVLSWRYPETGATLVLRAELGRVQAEGRAGLYGDARLLSGVFAYPEITGAGGEVYTPSANAKPELTGDALHWQLTMPLESAAGNVASLSVLAKFTENATWFCTAEVKGVEVVSAALAFGLDPDFVPSESAVERAGEPARLIWGTATMATGGELDASREGFGLGGSDPEHLSTSFLWTDNVVGQCWKALSGSDTRMKVVRLGSSPALVLQSSRSRFRWAIMWMPYHKLNLTGYKKRMLHFIRHPETPYHEYRERPSVCEYPTDEELESYAANGVKAMVWHHTWTGNNSRRREGFVVNEPEMRRAMRKAHGLGIDVITYIGIVPGRHPVLRYEDLSTRMFYDKNWDLQDFTLYSVAGRFAEFLPYMTDY
ncbi:MAG: hypothetical protein ACP5R5_12135 [Armatimonadota bacterium]